VRGFKTLSARRVNETAGTGDRGGFQTRALTIRWQRGYYEHVIRNEKP
jgi:hypothetical protein